jgi:transcription elongation factor SPT6
MLTCIVLFSRAVCDQVGVDINRAARSPWQAATLPFVAGLGPRKAQALIRAVQKNDGISSRYNMWHELEVLGKVVFRCESAGAS